MGLFGEDEIGIQSIAFGDRAIEVSYTEPRDQVPQVAMIRTIAIDLSLVEEEVADILDTCRQAVDRALVFVRNPEEKMKRRHRVEE